MRPLDFLRLARRFYCSREWRDSTNPPEPLAVAFRTAYRLVPEEWRSLAWRTYGACGPREAPRARWSRWLDNAGRWRRDAAKAEPGSWNRKFNLRLAKEFWIPRDPRDPRDSDTKAFALP